VIQLHILSGKMAGADFVVRHFPFHVGRASSADLQIEDAGIWDQHLTFSITPDRTVEVAAQSGALVSINDQSVSTAPLRNGDIIELGAVRIRFSLSPVRQKGLRLRESLVWIGLSLIALVEVSLIYWLLETD
jgi:hypothetical protein